MPLFFRLNAARAATFPVNAANAANYPVKHRQLRYFFGSTPLTPVFFPFKRC